MKYLLDTCVISELINQYRNEKVLAWINNKDEDSLFISVLTLGEIRKGIAKLPDSKKKRILTDWVETDLKQRFKERTLDITEDIAGCWGNILGESEKKGRKLPVIDTLIAATAITENLTVATRNIKDIKDSGCKLVNPWE